MSFMPLHTSRLLLRAPTKNDLPVLSRLMNDPAIARDYGATRYPCTPWSVRRSLAPSGPRARQIIGLSYVIVLRSNPRIVIGGADISLFNTRSWPIIGYWIARPHRRRGFATETAKALIAAIFQKSQVRVVSARCYTANSVSQRTLRAAGMRRVRNRWMRNAERQCYLPCLVYEITRADWERQTARCAREYGDSETAA